jgi:hypothetical protein
MANCNPAAMSGCFRSKPGGQIMHRSTVRRAAVACLCLPLLGSCAAQMENMRLAFADDSRGQVTFRIAESEKGIGTITPGVIAEIENCGFAARAFRRDGRVVVDTQYDFDSQTIMNSNLDCLPTDWSRRDVSLVTAKGLLFTRYTTTVWFQQPTVIRHGNSELKKATSGSIAPVVRPKEEPVRITGRVLAADEKPPAPAWEKSEPFFPLELTVRVPGEIDSVSTDGTDLAAAALRADQAVDEATNQATVEGIAKPGWTLAYRKAFDNKLDGIVAALARGEKRAIPLYSYKVVIKSSVSNVELSTLLALLGLLFGSGLIGRLFALRTAKSREVPKKAG